MIDIIIMSVCAVGTIAAAVNANRTDSFKGMLLWSIIGALELIVTILKVIQIFAWLLL